MDLEQPDRPLTLEEVVVLFVDMVLVASLFLDLGSWTSEGSDLQVRDFFSENQTLGSFLFFFSILVLEASISFYPFSTGFGIPKNMRTREA